ncbi:MAG: class I SAM-dependent methyltransferase [Elusimicrobia bacterium]|nr:class I SAM-dependent methyltransferase [Elusimicrobiota bacterium]
MTRSPKTLQVINRCRSCDGERLVSVLDLGRQPLANALLESPRRKEAAYPLSISYCGDCSLVQLDQTIDPAKLFSRYVWVTGTSTTASRFADRFCDELLRRSGVAKGSFVLEAASNDGTFLRPFLRRGLRVLGVDPARNIVALANKAGVPSHCAFFGEKVARGLARTRGPAQLVFARNVLPHVEDPHDFIEGLRAALEPEGVLAIEVHHAKVILEGLHYDSIYHEHLCYFTLKSLERLLNRHGLFAFDLSTSPISGGSIVVYARRRLVAPSRALRALRDQEERAGTNRLASWRLFAKRAFSHRRGLIEAVKRLGRGGRRVVGWGASARSSTMLNFCRIDHRLLAEIADMNPLKQGLHTAGTLIPIRAPEEVLARDPAGVLLLAWNFTDEIVGLLRGFKSKADLLLPLPGAPRILRESAWSRRSLKKSYS